MLHVPGDVRCALHVEDYQGRYMKTANGFRIDYREVMEVTHDILRDFGSEYVYEVCPINGCAYVHSYEVIIDGEPKEKEVPGCIVGQILFQLGVPLASMKNYGSLTEHTRGRLVRNEGIELTDKAFDFLTMAQFFQDQGATGYASIPWGKAVRYAEDIVTRYSYSSTEGRVSWSYDNPYTEE